MTDSDLEKEVRELKEIVKELVKIQARQIQNQTQTSSPISPPQPQVNKEELEEELREHDLGELVWFALKKDLIRRGRGPED